MCVRVIGRVSSRYPTVSTPPGSPPAHPHSEKPPSPPKHEDGSSLLPQRPSQNSHPGPMHNPHPRQPSQKSLIKVPLHLIPSLIRSPSDHINLGRKVIRVLRRRNRHVPPPPSSLQRSHHLHRLHLRNIVDSRPHLHRPHRHLEVLPINHPVHPSLPTERFQLDQIANLDPFRKMRLRSRITLIPDDSHGQRRSNLTPPNSLRSPENRSSESREIFFATVCRRCLHGLAKLIRKVLDKRVQVRLNSLVRAFCSTRPSTSTRAFPARAPVSRSRSASRSTSAAGAAHAASRETPRCPRSG